MTKSTITKTLAALTIAAAAAAAVAPMAAPAQSYCYQVADFIAPDLLRCQRIGSDYLGRPIWLCCER